MGEIASQITNLTIVYSTVYIRRRSKKTKKLRVTGLCAGNSLGTGEFPAQMANNAENVSIWWRHHVPEATLGLYTLRRHLLIGIGISIIILRLSSGLKWKSLYPFIDCVFLEYLAILSKGSNLGEISIKIQKNLFKKTKYLRRDVDMLFRRVSLFSGTVRVHASKRHNSCTASICSEPSASGPVRMQNLKLVIRSWYC